MEQFANFLALTTLNMSGGLDNSATTITVNSISSPFPTSFPFRIRIDDEIMKVTATPGAGQWTVVRGDGGTTAVVHSNGARVSPVVTKEALDAIVAILQGGSEISNRRVLNLNGEEFTVTDNSGSSRADISLASRIGEVHTKPVIGNFTFDSHSIAGTPTAVQQASSIYVYHPGTSTDQNVELYMTPPATPYTVIAKVIPFGLAFSFTSMGLYFGDGTKLFRVVFQFGNNHITVDKYTAWNTFSTAPFDQSAAVFTFYNWLKITDDGTNKKFFIGPDGLNWMQVYSEASASFISSTTRIGVALNGNTGGANNGKVAGMILVSWKVN